MVRYPIIPIISVGTGSVRRERVGYDQVLFGIFDGHGDDGIQGCSGTALNAFYIGFSWIRLLCILQMAETKIGTLKNLPLTASVRTQKYGNA